MDGVDTATWRKSSYSGNNGGDCVEVAGTAGTAGTASAVGAAGAVLVRDTVNRAGPRLSIPVSAWQEFTDSLR